jgi:hypothetical protein
VDNGHVAGDGVATTIVNQYLSSTRSRSASSISLADRSLSRNSREKSQFWFTSIELHNATCLPATILSFGEPFQIILEGQASADLIGVRIGFAIMSATGTPIFNSFHTDSGITSHIHQGPVRFKISVSPNPLAPGLYEFGLGATGDNVTDWVPSVLSFEISALPYSASSVWHTYNGGLIRHHCSWETIQ